MFPLVINLAHISSPLNIYIHLRYFHQWRTTHPYVLADRMEDLTDPELLRVDPKTDRKISLYGYIRGTNLKADSDVHVPGVGDFKVNDY